MSPPVRRYLMAGAVIETVAEFPELVALGHDDPRQSTPADVCLMVDTTPDPLWTYEGEVLSSQPDVQLRHAAAGYVLDVDDTVVRFSPDGHTLLAWPDPDLDPVQFRHFVLDVAVPYALALTGRTVVHGTAVVHQGRALAFVGRSGAGKSTLAAALVAQGAALLADDCLCLERRADGLWLHPSYPGTRLRSDSLAALFPGLAAPPGGKAMIGAGPATFTAWADAAPVAAVVVLEPAGATEATVFRPMGRAEGFAALVKHRLRLDVGPLVAARLLEEFGPVADAAPVWELRVQPDLGGLAELAVGVVTHPW